MKSQHPEAHEKPDAKAVALGKFNALLSRPVWNKECDHVEADEIVLDYLDATSPEVGAQYRKCKENGFWYS